MLKKFKFKVVLYISMSNFKDSVLKVLNDF